MPCGRLPVSRPNTSTTSSAAPSGASQNGLSAVVEKKNGSPTARHVRQALPVFQWISGWTSATWMDNSGHREVGFAGGSSAAVKRNDQLPDMLAPATPLSRWNTTS